MAEALKPRRRAGALSLSGLAHKDTNFLSLWTTAAKKRKQDGVAHAQDGFSRTDFICAAIVAYDRVRRGVE